MKLANRLVFIKQHVRYPVPCNEIRTLWCKQSNWKFNQCQCNDAMILYLTIACDNQVFFPLKPFLWQMNWEIIQTFLQNCTSMYK